MCAQRGKQLSACVVGGGGLAQGLGGWWGGGLERLCVPWARGRGGEAGEPDAEPTGGDKGQSNTASGPQGHAAWPPHDCSCTGAAVRRARTGAPPLRLPNSASGVALQAGAHTPTAGVHKGQLEGSQGALSASPCPEDLPRMALGLRCCSPFRPGALNTHHQIGLSLARWGGGASPADRSPPTPVEVGRRPHGEGGAPNMYALN